MSDIEKEIRELKKAAKESHYWKDRYETLRTSLKDTLNSLTSLLGGKAVIKAPRQTRE